MFSAFRHSRPWKGLEPFVLRPDAEHAQLSRELQSRFTQPFQFPFPVLPLCPFISPAASLSGLDRLRLTFLIFSYILQLSLWPTIVLSCKETESARIFRLERQEGRTKSTSLRFGHIFAGICRK
ncbi:hypothetical protein WA026_011073 [Henosepilachna vigintioctopunctata]|uniref:Uncharacterized protein n=1 Tax=Henosepilachna vigintioctopunctata TaxID=420089 RepID=A0AAW1U6W3_9CUCU